MDIWVVSSFWLLWIMLLWTLVHIVDTHCQFSWVCLWVELLGHMVALCFTCWGMHNILCPCSETNYKTTYSQLLSGLSLSLGFKFLEKGITPVHLWNPLLSPAPTKWLSRFSESCWEWSWAMQCPFACDNTPETQALTPALPLPCNKWQLVRNMNSVLPMEHSSWLLTLLTCCGAFIWILRFL